MKKVLLSIVSLLIISGFAFAEDKKEEAKKPSGDESYDYLFDVKKSDKTKSVKEYLSDLSTKKDEAAIVEAADYVGKEEEKDAIPKLVTLLKDDKRLKVRLYAAIALGLIGEKEKGALDALGNAVLNDKSADVRYASLLAIHRIEIDQDTKIAQNKAEDFFKKVQTSESDPYILDYVNKMVEWYKKQ